MSSKTAEDASFVFIRDRGRKLAWPRQYGEELDAKMDALGDRIADMSIP